MNLTASALAVIVLLGPLCCGCDSKPSPPSDHAPPTSPEPRPWAAAWDCVTEYVQRHFDPGATEVEMARQAVKACEESIAKAERLLGIAPPKPPPDLEELLADRAASGVEAEERMRINRFRLETWQVARKVASDLLTPRQCVAPTSAASAAAPSASSRTR